MLLAGGIFLKISKDNGSVKVSLDSRELDYLGLDFSDFSGASPSAKIFLAGVISMLKRLDYADLGTNISIKVTRTENSLMIYLTPEKGSAEKKEAYTYALYSFSSPEPLIAFCKENLKKYVDRIAVCELYQKDEIYLLRVKFRYANSTFLSKKELKAGAVTGEIPFARAAEYADLISSCPLKKILEL